MKDFDFKVSARKDLGIQVPDTDKGKDNGVSGFIHKYAEDREKQYRELNSALEAIIHYIRGDITSLQFDEEIEVCRSWSVYRWYCNIPAMMRIVHDLPENIRLTWDVLIRESLVRELEDIIRFAENVDEYSINLFARLKVLVKCVVKALNKD